MSDVRIRNLDDGIVLQLKAIAKSRGQSLESHLRDLLVAVARQSRVALVADLEQLSAKMQVKSGNLPPASDIIREERDRWS